MEFTTQILIKERSPKINYNSGIFLTGSCFVENIGEKLDYFKLPNLRNPFGILYHPAAIENFIRKAVNEYQYSKEDIFYHNERWHSFEAHSELSNASASNLTEDLTARLAQTRKALLEATHIIITPGTSMVYRYRETNMFVANCHKVPQKQFDKEITEVEENYRLFISMISSIREINTEAKIIFTVSPVRHIKDGIVENQWSKACLIAAIHRIVNDTENNADYFPSYEILMDELRDYRYYAEDMIHPSNLAIQYIWEKFSSTWLSPDALKMLKRIEAVQKGLSHRPFNADSQAHQQFLKNLHKEIEAIKSQNSNINFF